MNENDKYFVCFFEKINRRKWLWILTVTILVSLIGFFLTILLQVAEKGRMEFTVISLMNIFLFSIPIGFTAAFLLFREQKKKYKKLKEKE